MVHDIFISYRREGGFETAWYLFEHLKRDGYRVTFDLDSLRNGRFDEALLARIDECTDFIVVLSKGCFDRTVDPNFPQENDWMRRELGHALEKKKNVIPILLGGYETPRQLPPDIDKVRHMNGPSYSKEYIDSFYGKLKTFLQARPRSFFAFLRLFFRKIRELFIAESYSDERQVEGENMAVASKSEIEGDAAENVLQKEMEQPKLDEVERCAQAGSDVQKDSGSLEGDALEVGEDVDATREAPSKFDSNCCPQASMGEECVAQGTATAMIGFEESEVQTEETPGGETPCDPAGQCVADIQRDGKLAQTNTGGRDGNLKEKGVDQDHKERAKRCKMAAAHGDVKAQYRLGEMYEHGNGVKKDIGRAVRWYRAAAEHGNSDAQCKLGWMCELGVGSQQNLLEAREWYLKAAEQGDAIAQFALGNLYEDGRGVQQNRAEAIKWLKMAAKQGYVDARVTLRRLSRRNKPWGGG